MPPVVIGALGVLGVVALGRLVARQWRKVNAELHADEPVPERLPRLKRDPATGVFHPDEMRRGH